MYACLRIRFNYRKRALSQLCALYSPLELPRQTIWGLHAGRGCVQFQGLGELSTGANKTQPNFVNRRFADELDRNQPIYTLSGLPMLLMALWAGSEIVA
jgi:hypothetical protein